jgi:chromosome segregation protein
MSAPPLRLRRLNLSGFKSFVDPVSLELACDLTSIVGPNGCGKSNLADAVIWVLGERSAKSLRGSKMEDVIFAGARGRKPLGMAEVSLELDIGSGFRGSDEDRLTIGRRVFRTGESQYSINGKTVRLKDVKDLLMDTGLGLRGYSMIEQGQIGMILSGKPQERRKLLEEAAGVTRYKERRRIAEFKLEESLANLARLDDILSEVERSRRSLKRQASAARRYRQRQIEYEELRGKVVNARWAALHGALSEGRKAIELAAAREAELTADLSRREAALAASRESFEGLRGELASRHRAEAELAAAIEGRQEFLKGARERLRDFGERLAAGRETERHRAHRLEELATSAELLDSQRADLVAERDRAATEVDDDQARIRQAESLVAEAGQRVEGLRARLLTSIGDLTGLRNRLHAEQVEREKAELRRHQLEAEAGRREAELDEARAATAAAADRVEVLEQTLTELAREADALRQARDRLAGERRTTTAASDETAAELAAKRQRSTLLGELAEADRERRQRLSAAFSEAGMAEPRFLTDEVDVPADWAGAIDLWLGRLTHAVVLPDDEEGLALARLLGSAGASLLRAADGGELAAPAIDDPAIHGAIGTALGLPAPLARALPPAYLVDAAADAERLARRHPGVAFLSRERLWAQSGVLHVPSDTAVPGLLARDQALATLTAEIPVLETALETLGKQLERLGGALGERDGELAALDERIGEARRELAVAAARREDLERRADRLETDRAAVETERGEIAAELERIAGRAEHLSGELATRELAHHQLEESFDRTQAEAASLRDDRESTRTSGVSRRGRLELISERLEALDQQRQRAARETAEAERQGTAWAEESARLGERRRQLEAAVQAAEGELQDRLERRDVSQSQVLEAQERVDRRAGELEQLEAEIVELRDRRDATRSEVGDRRVEQAALEQETEHLEEAYREHFGTGLPELPEPPEEALAELETDMDRCRRILERLGPVNLLAADEYEEQDQRHGFLIEQRADVAASVASLKATIREIDQTSGSRFRATFDAVNEQFKLLYQELFRGGTAEMRLLDEDDLLDSGIEIVARPPGKRLQNIMLLSGGEKALTAIALIFALFRTKPSPFCILDEVDAPLDDLNTARFLELLKKMSSETQFVIITHNKLTMESAGMLYGVTMQEKGVSSLVSVELDEVQTAEVREPGERTAAASA